MPKRPCALPPTRPISPCAHRWDVFRLGVQELRTAPSSASANVLAAGPLSFPQSMRRCCSAPNAPTMPHHGVRKGLPRCEPTEGRYPCEPMASATAGRAAYIVSKGVTTKRRRHRTSNQTTSHSIPYIHTHTPTNAHRCRVSITLNPNFHIPTCPAQTKPCPNPRLWGQRSARTASAVRHKPVMRRASKEEQRARNKPTNSTPRRLWTTKRRWK